MSPPHYSAENYISVEYLYIALLRITSERNITTKENYIREEYRHLIAADRNWHALLKSTS
jgi:hypothetical protein